jgi:hypothetical protein
MFLLPAGVVLPQALQLFVEMFGVDHLRLALSAVRVPDPGVERGLISPELAGSLGHRLG